MSDIELSPSDLAALKKLQKLQAKHGDLNKLLNSLPQASPAERDQTEPYLNEKEIKKIDSDLKVLNALSDFFEDNRPQTSAGSSRITLKASLIYLDIYKNDGLGSPLTVADITEKYGQNAALINMFIKERLLRGEDSKANKRSKILQIPDHLKDTLKKLIG